MQGLVDGREGHSTTKCITEMLNWLDTTYNSDAKDSGAFDFDYRAPLLRLLKGVDRKGLEVGSLLRLAGLDPQEVEEGGPIRGRELIQVMQVLKTELNDEQFGLSRRPMKLGSLSMLVEIALECDSLEEALDRISRFFELISDDLTLVVEHDGSNLWLALEGHDGFRDSEGFLIEFWLLTLHRLCSWMVGTMIPIKSVEVSLGDHDRSRLLAFLRSDWRGGCESNRLSIGLRYLSLPLVRTRSEWQRHVGMARLGIMPWPDDSGSFSTKVKALMLHHLRCAEPVPRLAGVAVALNTTPQTLRRRLDEEGTSYRRLVDELFRNVAIDYLYTQRRSVSDVAVLLGFSESRSFSRAFKRWTGVSPSAYQRQ